MIVKTNHPKEAFQVCELHGMKIKALNQNTIEIPYCGEEAFNDIICLLVAAQVNIFSLETAHDRLENFFIDLVNKKNSSAVPHKKNKEQVLELA